MTEVDANHFVDPDGVIVRSGELLGAEVVRLLRLGESPLIQLRELPGISSSYFNSFLRLVYDEMGPTALERFRFEFASPLLERIYDQSRSALLLSAAGGDK